MSIIDPWDHLQDAGFKLAEKIMLHTTLIVRNDEGRPDAVCSGILLRYNEWHFLATAGHTVKDYPTGGLFIFSKNKLISIVGNAKTNARPRDNDNQDLAFVNLADVCVAEIEATGLIFFDIKNIPIDHDDFPAPQ